VWEKGSGGNKGDRLLFLFVLFYVTVAPGIGTGEIFDYRRFRLLIFVSRRPPRTSFNWDRLNLAIAFVISSSIIFRCSGVSRFQISRTSFGVGILKSSRIMPAAHLKARPVCQKSADR
jgi:hypothetical protein